MKKENCFRLSMRACMTALLMLFAVALHAQNVTVKGSVTDNTGEAVIGATVRVAGTNTAVVTNVEGLFTIVAPSNGSLEISSIGYQQQVIAINGRNSIDVVLSDDAQTMDEVVVTALGIKKAEKALGYSVAKIDASEITKVGSPTFASALYGKAAGVRIQTAPGGGTSSVSISVRGLSSITGNTQPLIVMDGVPIRNGQANNSISEWSRSRIESNGLVDINPEDIESISILKGAAASALYGSEANNGVVVITTKKGSADGTTRVEFGANMSWEKAAYLPDLQTEFGPGDFGYRGESVSNPYGLATGGFMERTYNGKTYKSLYATNDYWGPRYDGSDVLYWDGTVRKYESMGNPWNDIFETGFNQQYNAAVTKGGEWGNMRLGYTYVNVDATQRNSNNNKHNFSLNGTINVTKGVKVDYSAQYLRQNIKNRAYRIARITNNFGGMVGSFDDVKTMVDKTVTSKGFRFTDSDGVSETPDENLVYSPGTAALMSEYFWNIMGNVQEENHSRLIAGLTPSWEIIQGLTLRGRIATDLTAEDIENRNSAVRGIGFTSNAGDLGSYGLMNRKYENYYGDVMLMFDRTFADVHNVTANVGWSGRNERMFSTSVNTEGGLSVTNWFNLAASNSQAKASMKDVRSLRTAVFGTLGYSYDNWIYIEGTIRNEKLSTLYKGYNSFTYPSVNASFIFTELMKDKKPTWWDFGKLRASYGIVGNGPDPYTANVLYNQSQIGSFLYNTIGNELGNLTLKPEKKHEFEVGLESKFFHNRLGFEISYYNNTIQDQILPVSLAKTAGGSSIMLNVGELKNQGVEFSVYGTPVLTKDFRWDVRANIAFNKNKVTKLMEGLENIRHFDDAGAIYLYSYVDEPMGDWYGYKWQRDENGRKIVDENGLPLREATLSKIGNAMPKGVGGFQTNFQYKNVFLDATFDFRIGGDVLNRYWQYGMNSGILKETLEGREGHGGLPYYYEGNNITSDGKTIAGEAPAGYTQFNDGIIVDGVHADGSENTTIVPAGRYYGRAYGWGTNNYRSYEDAVQDNSYLMLRELSLGYQLPKKICSKFSCENLSLSLYGRNLFYIFKNLKEMDAESGDGTHWASASVAGQSSAASRTIGISLRATFSGSKKKAGADTAYASYYGANSKNRTAAYAPAEEKVVEKIVEKVVEKPVVKEVVKEVATPVQSTYVATFAVNSAEIGNTAELAGIPSGSTVEIVAYASPEGKADVNQALSERRAEAVAKYLEKKGVKVVRTVAKGADSSHANRIAIVTVK